MLPVLFCFQSVKMNINNDDFYILWIDHCLQGHTRNIWINFLAEIHEIPSV